MRKLSLFLVFALYCFCSSAKAQGSLFSNVAKTKNSGFLDFNGYHDSRGGNVMTLNILANLPNRFQYFSLSNFMGTSQGSDISGIYSEQNIRWKTGAKSPIDFTAQWVIRNGPANDGLQIGTKLNLHDLPFLKNLFAKVNLSYSANFHLIALSDKNLHFFKQLEHVYRIKVLPKLLNERVYIGGFADQNIVRQEDGKTLVKWVSEHQIGIMALAHFYIVAEYRINDYLPSKKQGVGYGLEYKISF